MAHVSLQADDCRAYIKNGKLRFQAMRHDANGDLLDQVTIAFPLALAGKFAAPENLDRDIEEGHSDIDIFLNRVRDFIPEDNPD